MGAHRGLKLEPRERRPHARTSASDPRGWRVADLQARLREPAQQTLDELLRNDEAPPDARGQRARSKMKRRDDSKARIPSSTTVPNAAIERQRRSAGTGNYNQADRAVSRRAREFA